MNSPFQLCSPSIGLSFLLAMSAIAPTMAQSLATEQEIAKYSSDYIPEFKSTIVNQSSNPNLGKIDINVDFASFGDNKLELENGQSQLIHIKGALLFLNKNVAAKSRIEKKFKKINLILVPNSAQRGLSMSNGELIVKSDSFSSDKRYSSEDIKTFLLQKL
jgi:hypothetical protein